MTHILARMRQGNITADQIIRPARWLDTEPDVPEGKWFKRFPSLILCGEREFIKTLLIPGQAPDGQQIK